MPIPQKQAEIINIRSNSRTKEIREKRESKEAEKQQQDEI